MRDEVLRVRLACTRETKKEIKEKVKFGRERKSEREGAIIMHIPLSREPACSHLQALP